jgi:hypothetical protein
VSAITPYGFEFGAATITRCCEDKKKGWVFMTLETPRHKGIDAMQIHVTRTGRVRIFGKNGEWKAQKRTA